MANSVSVQIWGKDPVLKAYESRAVAAWSIFQGKQFLFKAETEDLGIGKKMLSDVLDMISPMSGAIYTLKVYEDLTDDGIKSTTADDGSFNFKLIPDGQAIGGSAGGGNAQLIQDIVTLRIQNAELMAELDSGEDDEPDEWDRIGAIMEKPIVVAAINKLFGIDIRPGSPSTIGAIPETESETLLDKAIETLRSKDPDLARHLWKLAEIAINKPSSFKFLLNTLDSM
jgi:hypothetical protein